jgi:hypothetical protein
VELLATPSNAVTRKTSEILSENMPTGCDITSLRQYMASSRQSYTMQGLRLRAEQDKSRTFYIRIFDVVKFRISSSFSRNQKFALNCV